MTDLAEQLLSAAIAAGAEAAEVFYSSTLSRPVIFEGNRLKQVETTQAEGMALRLWHQGKPGLAVGYGPIEPTALVEKALAISQLNQPELPLLSSGGGKVFPAVGRQVESNELVSWGKTAIARLRDRIPEVICEAELSCDIEHTRLINSVGLDYRSDDTTLSAYLSAEVISPDDFLCVGDSSVSRQALELETMIDRIAQRITWAKRVVPPLTGQVPVIFTPNAAWLLWDPLRLALSGKRVKEGSSPWSHRWSGDKSARHSQPVVSEAITLRQDPTLGPYSCPFDDEGTLTQAFTLIEGGYISNWYCDRRTGQADAAHPLPGLGLGSTGNGIRPDLGSYPTPGLINLLVTPGAAAGSAGSLDWQSLLDQHQEAIVIDQVLGEGGDITGNLSVNLELGYRVHRGEILGRVKDTMVSGNAYKALNQLGALGSDALWRGSTYTPSVLVSGLSVTG